MQPALLASDFTAGRVGDGGLFAAQSTQQGLVRLACVDGLRTSMAGEAFLILLVTHEMLRRYIYSMYCCSALSYSAAFCLALHCVFPGKQHWLVW